MTITLDTSQFKAAMERLRSAPDKIRKTALQDFGSEMVRRVQERCPPKQNALARSFRFAADADRVVIGSPLPWARILNYGGTIRPSGDPAYQDPAPPLQSRRGSVSEVTGKPIKALAIPLLKRSGSEGKLRPRDFANTFLFKSKSGKMFIAQKAVTASDVSTRKTITGFQKGGMSAARIKRQSKAEKEQGGIRLLFILLKSVNVKATHYAEFRPEDEALFGDIITDALIQMI